MGGSINSLKSPSPVTDSLEFLREEEGAARASSLNIKHNPAALGGLGPARSVRSPFSLGKVQGVTDELNKLLILTTWRGGPEAAGRAR